MSYKNGAGAEGPSGNQVTNVNKKKIYNVNKDEILLFNDILNEEELLCIKNKIKDDINHGNNFKLNIDNEENIWKKDLSADIFYTNNIFDILKQQINKNMELLNVECKIQKYGDNEEYHIDNINDKHITLNLQLYIKEDIIQIHNKEQKLLDLISDSIGMRELTRKPRLVTKKILNILEDNINEFNITDNNIEIENLKHITDYYTCKQNMFDEQGYLYIIPPDKPYIHTFEFIDNTCVVYPSFFFNKSKPFLLSSKNIRVSILFYCLLHD
jgi:hypothetical protein